MHLKIISTTVLTGSRASGLQYISRVVPSTYSTTMYFSSSSVTASKMVAMCGCESLPASDASAMNFGSGAKAWKDIWGAGQGIGAVEAIVPAADRIARMAAEYHATRDRLLG